MDRITLLLKAALEARGKVGLKMNLPQNRLASLLEKLPSLRRPTVAQLAEEGWVAIETIIDESVVRDIIPELKPLGAEGIIEYPLNKVVPETDFHQPTATTKTTAHGLHQETPQSQDRKHKRKKRMKQNRHKKRLRYKS